MHKRLLPIALAFAALASLASAADAWAGPRRVFIAGDSTAAEYGPERAPRNGWGQQLQGFLDRLDILVNNAGLIRRADAVDFSEKDWDDVMNVNIKSAFFMSQAAGKHFIAQGRGKIINIASMLSFQGGIRVPSYTASKSGIAGITRLLANEWAAKGVNINAIAPGYMATDNTAQLRADEDRNKAILDRIPAARWGEPADLGGTAVFLSSAASDYVNGAVIPVDGGWLAR